MQTLMFFVAFASLIAAADLPLNGEATVRFASLPESQSILGARDRFVQALSPFDRQSRLETDREVSEQEFLQFATANAREWKPDQVEKLSAVLQRLRQKFAPYRLPFPPIVLFVQTSGREEGNAAYCRANSIILPEKEVGESEQHLERLLLHEMFHILSSHNPTWRSELYKCIGFHVCPPIELPASLKSRKLTNPDAPHFDCYISLDVDGEATFAVPVLYSNADRFDVKKGGPFFRYLTFRLMAIERLEGTWHPIMDGTEPRMFEPKRTPDFMKQIGANTQYIIHPEEILADNFVHLIQRTPNLPSPHIINAMERVISSKNDLGR